jgi:hypothetical protein
LAAAQSPWAILNEALNYYKSKGGADYTLDIYNLLGDPALKLPVK